MRFVDVLAQMGCRRRRSASRASPFTGGPLRGIDVDMNDISDTVMTLAAVACFAEGPTTIRNVAHIRHKETDRLAALATELRRLGAEVDEFADGLTITPRPLHGAEVETYNDHRMAMSLALIGLKVPGVIIDEGGFHRRGRDEQGIRVVRPGHRPADARRAGARRGPHRRESVGHRMAAGVPDQRPGRPRDLPLALRSLPRGATHPNIKLDLAGVALVGAALMAIIYPLIQGRTAGWPAWCFALLAIGAVLLVVFLRHERSKGHNALIEPTLLTNRDYLSGVAVILALFGAFGGLLLSISLYGQLGEGWSPVEAGLMLTPMVVGMILGMFVSNAAVERLGRHLLHIGILLIAAGTAGLALLLTGANSVPAWELIPGLFFVGAGLGASLGQLFGSSSRASNMEEVGSASGVLEAAQQLSSALGVAILGTIFFSTFDHHLPTDALRVTAWACLVPLAAAFLLVFRLPMHPREDHDHG